MSDSKVARRKCPYTACRYGFYTGVVDHNKLCDFAAPHPKFIPKCIRAYSTLSNHLDHFVEVEVERNLLFTYFVAKVKMKTSLTVLKNVARDFHKMCQIESLF